MWKRDKNVWADNEGHNFPTPFKNTQSINCPVLEKNKKYTCETGSSLRILDCQCNQGYIYTLWLDRMV